ncbi:hypothetical protein NW852_05140 [Synechococcus sp. H60.1]
MGAGKPGEGDGVEALTGEGAIAHAVEVGNGGAVEGHAQEAPGSAARDGAVGAVDAAQEAAVGAGSAHLQQLNVGSQLWPEGLQAADKAFGCRLFLLPVLLRAQALPGLHPTGGKSVDDVAARRGQLRIQEGGNRDKDRALLRLQVLPIF